MSILKLGMHPRRLSENFYLKNLWNEPNSKTRFLAPLEKTILLCYLGIDLLETLRGGKA